MKARIGLAENSKVVEFEIDDAKTLQTDLEDGLGSGASLYWVTDVKGRKVGIPLGKVAFVEIDSEESRRTVGFSPGA